MTRDSRGWNWVGRRTIESVGDSWPPTGPKTWGWDDGGLCVQFEVGDVNEEVEEEIEEGGPWFGALDVVLVLIGVGKRVFDAENGLAQTRLRPGCDRGVKEVGRKG